MPKKDGSSPTRRTKSNKRHRNKNIYGKYSQRGGRVIIAKITQERQSKRKKTKGKRKKK